MRKSKIAIAVEVVVHPLKYQFTRLSFDIKEFLFQKFIRSRLLGMADLERQHMDAMIELYRALGGGWQ